MEEELPWEPVFHVCVCVFTCSAVLERAKVLTTMRHRLARLDNVWGVGGGQRPVMFLIGKVSWSREQGLRVPRGIVRKRGSKLLDRGRKDKGIGGRKGMLQVAFGQTRVGNRCLNNGVYGKRGMDGPLQVGDVPWNMGRGGI